MANEEFYLKQILDGIKDTVDSVKNTMATQHNSFNVKLDMLIDRHAITDRKADKANERIDDQAANLINIKELAERALKLGEDLENSKKKMLWTFGGISIGASFAGSKIAAFFNGLFQ